MTCGERCPSVGVTRGRLYGCSDFGVLPHKLVVTRPRVVMFLSPFHKSAAGMDPCEELSLLDKINAAAPTPLKSFDAFPNSTSHPLVVSMARLLSRESLVRFHEASRRRPSSMRPCLANLHITSLGHGYGSNIHVDHSRMRLPPHG